MNIRSYLDSTYLKTPEQAGLSVSENREVVRRFVSEAIAEKFKLIMIRPDMVRMAKEMVADARSGVLVGTVIDFPEGTSDIDSKLKEAAQAIEDGADDLDFVCNYSAFINGDIDKVREEVLRGTTLGVEKGKTVKWIIEVAALQPEEIIKLSALIKNCVVSNFKEEVYESVFVKSSTGFYKTDNGSPNGATIPAIKMMLDNASPLQIKAAGGVRNYEEAVEMIRLGVKRIGTSAAKAIADGSKTDGGY
jgi:deoxyribose-phosphate aldolase